MTTMTENKTETFEPAAFADVHEGDRVRFVTANNGFGSDGGDLWRTGTVTKVTDKTVTVEVTGPNPLAEDVFRGGKSRKLGRTARLRQADWHHRCVSKAATDQSATVPTATDLPKGARVMDAEGRMGTVNGVDVGRVTLPDHPNFGREYVGVNWDADDKRPWGDRSRPFVDELRIDLIAPVTDEEGSQFCGACGEVFETAATLDAHQAETGHEMDQPDHPLRKTPDLRQLANPKQADPETIAEIHASRCPECKGAGCPTCGYKGVPRTVCPAHHVVDKRGGRAIELGTIPTCESGITYGAWSEGAGGFVYSGVGCATDAANWAADELRELAKDDDTDKFEILAICREHEEQPKDGCEECAEEPEGD